MAAGFPVAPGVGLDRRPVAAAVARVLCQLIAVAVGRGPVIVGLTGGPVGCLVVLSEVGLVVGEPPLALRGRRGWAGGLTHRRLCRTRRHRPLSSPAVSRLDEFLEAPEIALHAAGDQAEPIADLLRHPFGLVRQPDCHPRALRAQRLEADQAFGELPHGAAPAEALIGDLLGDMGVPLLALAADAGHPVQALATERPDLLDPFHEPWEVLEPRPLLIGRGHRDIDLGRTLDRLHLPSFRRPLDRRRGGPPGPARHVATHDLRRAVGACIVGLDGY
jgi:hypothetical protein